MERVFAWNGTDTTQFESAASFLSSGVTITPSVVADSTAPLGNLLRITGGGSTTGTRAAVLLWTTTVSLDRFVIRAELAAWTGASGYAGPAFFGDVSLGANRLHCFAHLGGASGWAFRVDDNTLTMDNVNEGPTITTTNPRGIWFHEVIGRRPATGIPQFNIYSGVTVRQGGNANPTDVRRPGDIPGSPPSTWNGLATNRIGIALAAGGGASLPTIDFHSFEVWDPLAAGADETAPTISNVSPASGSAITANQAISFDVEDETNLTAVWVAVHFPATDAYEVVWDGSAFSEQYAGSTADAIADGLSFSVTRTGGWQWAPEIVVKGYDGNESA